MQVIVYAQDLSGRKDDGHYTKPDLASALNIFFEADSTGFTWDPDGEEPFTRQDAEEIFATERRVTFFNSDGERIAIAADVSAKLAVG